MTVIIPPSPPQEDQTMPAPAKSPIAVSDDEKFQGKESNKWSSQKSIRPVTRQVKGNAKRPSMRSKNGGEKRRSICRRKSNRWSINVSVTIVQQYVRDRPNLFFFNMKLQDDEDLLAILEREGDLHNLSVSIRWIEVASELHNGRTAKQCRDRWFNHLRKGIKKGDWTIVEEDIINDMYMTFGGR